MKRVVIFIIMTILAFASCDPFGNCEFEDKEGIAIVLDMSAVTTQVDNVHIYAFDPSDRLDRYKYYASLAELKSNKLYLDHGDYAIVAVLNVGEEFSPPESAVVKASAEELPYIMLADFIAWLKQVKPQYPDMMTGMSRNVTTDDGSEYVIIEIAEGTTNLKSNILRFEVTPPDGVMPDYSTRAPYSKSVIADHHLRAVAEVYKKGTALRVHSYSAVVSNSTLDLHLQPGDYDVLLWADHVPIDIGTDADHHYSTSSLRGVTFAEHIEYMPGVESRHAYSLKVGAALADVPVTSISAPMNRVLAKYQLVATDVEKYKDLIRANGEDKYPLIENLTVNISYNGYFPISHDVHTDKPNSSGAGVQFNSTFTDITATTAAVGSDYIFAASPVSGDDPPYINATITITEKESEKVITRKIVRIDYLRGHITTVESDFLTAGIVGTGITIETNWDGVIDVYF